MRSGVGVHSICQIFNPSIKNNNANIKVNETTRIPIFCSLSYPSRSSPTPHVPEVLRVNYSTLLSQTAQVRALLTVLL